MKVWMVLCLALVLAVPVSAEISEINVAEAYPNANASERRQMLRLAQDYRFLTVADLPKALEFRRKFPKMKAKDFPRLWPIYKENPDVSAFTLFRALLSGSASEMPDVHRVNVASPMLQKHRGDPGYRAGLPPQFDQVVRRVLKGRKSVSGAVVAVYRPDLGYRVSAYGLEHAESGASMSADAVFDVGSVMKSMRWVLLHRLAEAGAVDIDAPVNRYVSEPPLGNITIKHLMQHSSGMIDITESKRFMSSVFSHMRKGESRVYTYGEMVGFLAASSGFGFREGFAKRFVAGEDFRYSSFGPLIAGMVAEAATGRDVHELMYAEVFAPLQMESTTHMGLDPRPNRLVGGYQKPGHRQTAVDDYSNTLGFSSAFGGLIYSDAYDLVRFAANVFTNREYLSEATVHSIAGETVHASLGEVGLGFFRYAFWDGSFWGHLGSSIHGQSSAIAFRPDDSLAIVVLTNIRSEHDDFKTQNMLISALGQVGSLSSGREAR